jgi:hypothetical protein
MKLKNGAIKLKILIKLVLLISFESLDPKLREIFEMQENLRMK